MVPQDTDTQWAYWEGLLKFYKAWHSPGRYLELDSVLLHACCQAKECYLQGQIGNPEGEEVGKSASGP